MDARVDTIMINPLGEPGSGKSTFSFWLVHALKMRGVEAEFVPEVIKYETYSDEGSARVRSGRHDLKFLARQDALIRPLAGRVEVIVNDGCLPAFLYYAMQRLPGDKVDSMRRHIARRMAAHGAVDRRYVALVRRHAYSSSGRYQDEAAATAMRSGILDAMAREYDIHPQILDDDMSRDRWLDGLVREVRSRRRLRHGSIPDASSIETASCQAGLCATGRVPGKTLPRRTQPRQPAATRRAP